MTYATEFPDYPSASLPAIPNDWRDASYHNDTCPSWQTGSLHIWVDYPDPEQREHPAARRFTVAKLDADGCITADPPILETDDWQQVLNLTAA